MDIKIRYEALIDSGADFNILPAGLIDVLGLERNKLKEVYFSGINGELNKGEVAELSVCLGDFNFKTHFVFAGIPDLMGVLGQYGFFDLFKIKFSLKEREIEIIPYN